MTTERNQNYKLKYRPSPRSHFAKYGEPLPMTGNPPEARDVTDWSERSEIIYDHMIAEKLGAAYVPMKSRRGLWFYEVTASD